MENSVSKREFKRALDNKTKEQFFNNTHIKKLVEHIKSTHELALCYRGNYCNIYYQGRSLMKIYLSSKIYAEFNFNYARFDKDYQAKSDVLRDLGCSGCCINPIKITEDNITRTLKIPFDNKTLPNIVDIFQMLKDISDSFVFDNEAESDAVDYFKGGIKSKKKKFIEKTAQQKLFLENFKNPNFFFFDMEYAQARDSKDDNNGNTSGRFDIQGLRKLDKNQYELVLIEVKSTNSACTGPSGLVDHVQDLEIYIGTDDYCKVRLEDAAKIMEMNQELFQIGWQQENVIVNNVKKLFIFTDEVKDYPSKPRSTAFCMLENQQLKKEEVHCMQIDSAWRI